MMRLLSILLIAGIVVSPFVILNLSVMSQLNHMKHFYSTMDETVQKIAEDAGPAQNK